MATEFDNFDLSFPTNLVTSSSKKDENYIQGYWQRIFIEPNPITGERYNIGIACHFNDQVYTRLIDTTDRLKCIFNTSALNNIQFAIKHIDDILKNKDSTPDIFELSDLLPASGSSIEEIINDLFFDVVPLGRPSKTIHNTNSSAMITKEKLVFDVYNHLKQAYSLYADKIIPQQRSLVIDSIGHTVDVPLIGKSQAADLISVTYKRAFDIERIINQSVVDLSAVKSYKKRFHKTGLFLLRPTLDLGFSKKEVIQAEQAIDNMLWKLKRDFHLSVENSTQDLAQSAAQWFELTA